MEYRRLGRDGPVVPGLGLGTRPLGGSMGPVSQAQAIATVRAAIDRGITVVDTAQAFRSSEAVLGLALRDGYRQRCFLATAVSGDYSRRGIQVALEGSLRQLGVEYVDLYQIHGWDPRYPIAESMDALVGLQEQGKVRYLGVSNFGAAELQQAMQDTQLWSNQVRYNLLDRQVEAWDLRFCRDHGIGVLAHSPLAKGLLAGGWWPGRVFVPADERSSSARFPAQAAGRYADVVERLAKLAMEHDLTLVQLALAWVLRQEAVTCVLVGARSPEQTGEHLGAVGVQLDDEELSRVDQILRGTPVPV
ncbi:MAG: aldo/keto reductase [Candidatus Latescibacterota bacterium]